MALLYENTVDDSAWYRHFLLMSENKLAPIAPGFYRVEDRDYSEDYNHRNIQNTNSDSTEGCKTTSATEREDKVPITISTPSDQVITQTHSKECEVARQRHSARNTIKPKKRKVLAVEQSGGEKKPRRTNSVTYCKEPKGFKKTHYLAW